MKKIYILCFISFLLLSLSKNLYSQNNGWSSPLNISNTQYHSTSPAMAINKEGKLFVVWSEWDQPQNDLLARIYYTTCTGSQWSDPIPITTELGKADWTPYIAVDTLGNPHIVWGEWLSGNVFYKYYDGSSWSDPVNVSEQPGGAYYPCIAIGNDNTVHIAWHQDGVFYRQLKDNQWSDKIRLSDTTMSAGSVKLCTDSNGSVHFTWASLGPNEEEWRIWYRKLENNIFNEPELVYFDTTLHPSSQPDIAVFNNNLPAIVWSHTTQHGPLPVIRKIFYSEFNGVEWSDAEAVSDSSRSYRPDISIGGNNVPYLVWDYIVVTPVEDYGDVLFLYKINGNWTIPENLAYQLPFSSGGAKIVIDIENNLYVIWGYGEPSPDPTGEVYYSSHNKITSVINEKDSLTVEDFALYQNYPNPFNPLTTIVFSIVKKEKVILEVYDLLGQKVKLLLNDEIEKGRYKINFNSLGLSSGIYFYKLSTGRNSITKKMVILQ